MRSRRAICDIGAFLGGAALLSGVLLLFAPGALAPPRAYAQDAAYAHPCLNAYSDSDDDYGQIDAEEVDRYNTRMEATRAHMYASKGAQCQRISSIGVITEHGGQFEFGWIRGWWGPSSCSGVNHDHFYTRPTLFNVRFTNSGHYSCKFWPHRHPGSGSRDVYRASDINANTYWGSFFKGTELQPRGVHMDFNQGTGAINMERGNPDDGGYSDFSKISEWHVTNGWSYFDNIRRYFDIDPDYHFQRFNGHHGRTVK